MINAIIAGRAELRLYFYAALFRFKNMVFLYVKREKKKVSTSVRELKFKRIHFTPPV